MAEVFLQVSLKKSRKIITANTKTVWNNTVVFKDVFTKMVPIMELPNPTPIILDPHM